MEGRPAQSWKDTRSVNILSSVGYQGFVPGEHEKSGSPDKSKELVLFAVVKEEEKAKHINPKRSTCWAFSFIFYQPDRYGSGANTQWLALRLNHHIWCDCAMHVAITYTFTNSTFMTQRYSKWFTIHQPISPDNSANATYNGEYNGVRDPIGQGQVGQIYRVVILSSTKLDAPNPPFSTGESFDI